MGLFSDDNSAALARINRKLDLIIEHLGIEVIDRTTSPALADAIANGRKIEAIKIYREQTGAGLREAKDHIESLMH